VNPDRSAAQRIRLERHCRVGLAPLEDRAFARRTRKKRYVITRFSYPYAVKGLRGAIARHSGPRYPYSLKAQNFKNEVGDITFTDQ
jgi:hypothetical protein